MVLTFRVKTKQRLKKIKVRPGSCHTQYLVHKSLLTDRVMNSVCESVRQPYFLGCQDREQNDDTYVLSVPGDQQKTRPFR